MEGEPILSNTAATMEVHHHAHSNRKTFRHYLFEFFMLFFAVFCGFLAEYFLEHTIEHQREKQFIGSMIKDLKDDTSRIRKVDVYTDNQILGMDSLLHILHNRYTHKDSVTRAYLLYIKYALGYERVIFNTRTLTQLKNSGGMRLIRNQSVSDSIMNYDAGIQNCELQFDVVRDSWNDEAIFSYQLFDLRAALNKDSPPVTYVSTDPKTMSAYANRLIMFQAVVRNYNAIIGQQQALATRLISFLEKQYHLD
jgi:hypothetical protein